MRHPFFIVLFLFFGLTAFGQDYTYSKSWKESVLLESGTKGIEHLYLGCATCISKSRARADSLFKTFPLDTAMVYVKHHSYTIRFYSFLRILALDQSAALEYLKESVEDSTSVDIRGACMFHTLKFNELLASEFEWVIICKSKGLSCARDGRGYMFNKSHRKKGRSELKKFKVLVKSYGLNTYY